MEKDFKNIELDIEQESDNDSLNKKKVKHMKRKDSEHYKNLKSIYDRSAEFNEFISKINYLQLKKIFKKDRKSVV